VQTPAIDTPGGRFRVRLHGRAAALVLVFSNALGTTLEIWDAQAQHFAQRRWPAAPSPGWSTMWVCWHQTLKNTMGCAMVTMFVVHCSIRIAAILIRPHL
jgi:hypothetical protein